MEDKPIIWIKTEIKTPPFSEKAKIEAGILLRRLQFGEKLSMPDSRPMPIIGKSCHELRIKDNIQRIVWRIIYYITKEYIVVLEAFGKKSEKTPQELIKRCQGRLSRFKSDYEDWEEPRGEAVSIL